jgi:hypothetical protein
MSKSAMSLPPHFQGSKFLSFLLLHYPKINSFHITYSNDLADLNNVNKEFLPKIPHNKNLPKKSSQKISPKQFLPKNPPKKIHTKKSSQKNPPKKFL